MTPNNKTTPQCCEHQDNEISELPCDCKCHNTTPVEEWEREFDRRFPKNYQIPIDANGLSVMIPSIKSFIRNLITLREERAREEDEKIFGWLLGGEGDFRAREDGEGAYWWRKELMDRLEARSRSS